MEEMPAGNGHDENRLDRIEAALEALVRSQSHLLESQPTLEQGHKDLLRSQVLMQDELRQFASKSEARFRAHGGASSESEEASSASRATSEKLRTKSTPSSTSWTTTCATTARAAPDGMQIANRRVLVTGADGFIGSHLVELLVQRGAKVTALSLYNSFNDWGWLEALSCLNDIEVVTGDVRDAHFCLELTRKAEVVFHLAALIPIPYSYRAPSSFVDTNAPAL